MIQFNLLPDVKLDYIRARSRKRMIIGTSAIVASVFFGLFLILFLFVKVNQTQYLNALTKDISKNVKKIQSKQDLDKVLTIQNQLSTLTGLHDQKVVSSRLIDYLTQLLPNQSQISSIDVDFQANTIKIQGTSDSLGTVNKFVDTLKFTDYKVNDDSKKSGKAFSNVVLQTFTVDKSAPGKPGQASYSVQFSFDPVIFQNVKGEVAPDTQPVMLTVPNIISTRSETEKPSVLFNSAQPQEKTGN